MPDRMTKKAQMSEVAAYKKRLWEKPVLRNLFLELTLQCNENCIHCGSRCGDVRSRELTAEQYAAFLDKVKRDFGTGTLMLHVTGGEPLLRRDFFDIVGYANKLGFHWGMTSNATLIDDAAAAKLKQCGMRTISVSIDGLRETHDAFRQRSGGYDAAMAGIDALIRQGGFGHIQVTTVVHKNNIEQLEELFWIMCALDIDSWRIINIEPIGRAKTHPELLLDREDYKRLFTFIRSKRSEGLPVMYGCSHYLGADFEREVRDWYFLCNAGIYTASVMANGDIGACLDIERRDELIQGNILTDDFKEVWEKKFQMYRRELSETNAACRTCSEKVFCGGGSFHSWDFDKNEQAVCFKGILF